MGELVVGDPYLHRAQKRYPIINLTWQEGGGGGGVFCFYTVRKPSVRSPVFQAQVQRCLGTLPTLKGLKSPCVWVASVALDSGRPS